MSDLQQDAEGRRQAYLAVKRSEAQAFAGADVAWECFQHFIKI